MRHTSPSPDQPPDAAMFKACLAQIAASVVIATTIDSAGERWGFTATSFSAVSLEPPLVLVCLAHSAQCYPAFRNAPHFAISILTREHQEVAQRFASRGADKFASGDFRPGLHEMPILSAAGAYLVCSTHQRMTVGDHDILIGQVLSAGLPAEAHSEVLLYHRRQFHMFGRTPKA
ncbi:flavin reductase family protein [Rhodoligotrophos ferricapiens]|uniref:flavin reductase family protein n=1 Tax=Rhodoligotrophos ferricapiens TaxID=3069264 RepID=UPI00315CB11F